MGAGRPKQSAAKSLAADGLRREWAERVRALRAARDWTQAELAAHLGVSAHRVRHWEAGRSLPGEGERAAFWRLFMEPGGVEMPVAPGVEVRAGEMVAMGDDGCVRPAKGGQEG
jgi:hypothetical protein